MPLEADLKTTTIKHRNQSITNKGEQVSFWVKSESG